MRATATWPGGAPSGASACATRLKRSATAAGATCRLRATSPVRVVKYHARPSALPSSTASTVSAMVAWHFTAAPRSCNAENAHGAPRTSGGARSPALLCIAVLARGAASVLVVDGGRWSGGRALACVRWATVCASACLLRL